MRRRCGWFGLIAFVLAVLAMAWPRAVLAQDVASTNAKSDLLSRLLDPDARERETAARALLATPVAQLPALAEALAEVPAPRPPAMRLPLRRVVHYAHLQEAKRRWFAEQPEPRDSIQPAGRQPIGGPFLGISRPEAFFTNEFLQQFNLEVWLNGVPPGQSARGLILFGLAPGFVASTALQEGDVIVGMERTAINSSVRPIGDFFGLVELLDFTEAGEQIRLRIRRGGKFEWVELQLDTRVDTLSPRWAELSREAEEQAAAQWHELFEPLFAEQAPPADAPESNGAPSTRPADGTVAAQTEGTSPGA